MLRFSPSVDNPALQRFDELLRSAVDHITNSALSDSQWLQASLSIKLGGLAVGTVTSLAIPAFLASAASTLSLQEQILALFCALAQGANILSDIFPHVRFF